MLDRSDTQGQPLAQQAAQDFLYRGLAVPRRQVQDVQIVLVRRARVAGHQRVVGQPEDARREQLLTIAVLGERSRLAHQPVNDVAIVDALLVPATQPRQYLDPLLRVPDLHVLDEQPHLDVLADQPAGHRVAVTADMDQAALIDLRTQPLARLQPPRRQRPQFHYLLGQPRPPARIELFQDLTQELGVRLPAAEVAAAPQEQRLVHRLLETAVPLLDVPILVSVVGLDLLAH